MRRGLGLLGATLAAISWPALACETEPDISQLPGETQKEAVERYEQADSDQWVIRRYHRESSSFKQARTLYIAKVVVSNRDDGVRAKPTTIVKPIEAIRGSLPTENRTLTEVARHSCANWGDGYGDGEGSAARAGSLVVVFEGLPKSKERPNGVDSLMATSVRTFELLDPLYKHGKHIPEHVLLGTAPSEN